MCGVGEELVPPPVQVRVTGQVTDSGVRTTAITEARDPELAQRFEIPHANVGEKRKGPDPPPPDGVLTFHLRQSVPLAPPRARQHHRVCT